MLAELREALIMDEQDRYSARLTKINLVLSRQNRVAALTPHMAGYVARLIPAAVEMGVDPVRLNATLGTCPNHAELGLAWLNDATTKVTLDVALACAIPFNSVQQALEEYLSTIHTNPDSASASDVTALELQLRDRKRDLHLELIKLLSGVAARRGNQGGITTAVNPPPTVPSIRGAAVRYLPAAVHVGIAAAAIVLGGPAALLASVAVELLKNDVTALLDRVQVQLERPGRERQPEHELGLNGPTL